MHTVDSPMKIGGGNHEII